MSVLYYVSKVFEKSMCSRLWSFLDEQKTQVSYQFRFRKISFHIYGFNDFGG